VLLRISNFQQGGFVHAEAVEAFTLEPAIPRPPQEGSPHLFSTAGTTQGLVPEHIADLEALLQDNRPPRATATKALEIGLAAAVSPKSGGAIGRSWSSAVIPISPTDPIWVQHHAPSTTRVIFGPNLVDASAGSAPVIGLSNIRIEVATPMSFGFAGTPRNAPCPCGSGQKYKRCHGAPGAGQGGFFLNRLSAPSQNRAETA
jgi:hypothetical protein